MNSLTPLGLYSPYMIYGSLSAMMALVFWRLGLLRAEPGATPDGAILTRYQWSCLAAGAFVHIFCDAAELFLGLTFLKMPGIPHDGVSVLLGISFLFFFEAGRSAFPRWLPRWIYLPLLACVSAGAYAGADEFRAAVRGLIAMPSMLLLATAVLVRLKRMNFYCPQMRTAAILSIIFGLYYGLLTPKMLSFPAWKWNINDLSEILGFPLQLLGPLILTAAAVLISDYALNTRDLRLNIPSIPKRIALRRTVFILLGVIITSGTLASDLLAVHSAHGVYRLAEAAGLSYAKQLGHHNPAQFQGSAFLHAHPLIEELMLFYRPDASAPWQYLDADGEVSRNDRFQARLDNVYESGKTTLCVGDDTTSTGNACSTFFIPVQKVSGANASVLVLRIPHLLLYRIMRSERLQGFWFTLVLCSVLLLPWVGYASAQERRLAAAKSDEQFNAFFRDNPMSGLILDPERGMILSANTAAEHFFLYPPGGLVRKPFSVLKLVPLETAPGSSVFDHERSGGEIRRLRMCESEMFYRGRKSVLCFFSDESDCEREKSHIEQELNLLRETFEAFPVLFYVIGADGRYRVFNNAFAEAMNIPRAELLGAFASKLNSNAFQRLLAQHNVPTGKLVLDGRSYLHNRRTFSREDGSIAAAGTLCELSDSAFQPPSR